MKRTVFFILFIISYLGAFAQLKFVLDYAAFKTPEGQAYLEVYLAISGRSLTYEVDSNGTFSGSAELTYLIEDGEKVIAFDKFQLNSPNYEKTIEVSDMIDLRRMLLPNGSYTFTIIAKDIKSKDKTEKTFDLRTIEFKQEKLHFSEIQLANNVEPATTESPFVKNGFLISPNLTHYYKDTDSMLYFYVELYNSMNILGKEGKFLTEYAIVADGTNDVIDDFRGIKRQDPVEILPMIHSFDLRELPSGNYELLLKAVDQKNEVLAERRIKFENNNTLLLDYSNVSASNTFVDSINDIAELAFYIKALNPISTPAERTFAENQLGYADLDFMKRFFLNFWKSRNSTNPEEAWLDYKTEIKKADELFGYGNIQGFQTERGRVFLQYGRPDVMRDVPYEYNTYPYSVWQYNKLGGQTNRKFIFYSPSMEMLGYKVLHSNVMGEVINHNWEYELENRTTSGVTLGREIEHNEVINERARDLWNNPR